VQHPSFLALPLTVVLLVSVDSFAAKDKKTLTVTAVTHNSRVNQSTSYYTTPGSSNTNCSGTGTDTGGGTTQVNMGCETTTTPATTTPITTSTIDVADKVEGLGMVYTIVCTAHWIGSNCAPLIDGDMFQVVVEGTTMWVYARKGGNQGKPVKIKYKILDIRPTPPNP